MKTLRHSIDRAEILARLDNIRPDARPQWGKMTAAEMVTHLSDSFHSAFGERDVKSIGGPLHHTVVKWFALYLPAPWPKNVPTRPENDPQAEGTRPADFDADVTNLVSLVERFATVKGHGSWAPHPIFGQMTTEEWNRWAYLHMDHHLRQFNA